MPCYTVCADFLQESVRDRKDIINRTPEGAPIMPDYDRAAQLILAGRHGEALPFLDRVACAQEKHLRETGLPSSTEETALLFRNCPTWLSPDDSRLLLEAALPVRRKMSADPKVHFD